MANRVSTAVVEVLTQGDSSARVSTAAVEILGNQAPNCIASAIVVEVLTDRLILFNEESIGGVSVNGSTILGYITDIITSGGSLGGGEGSVGSISVRTTSGGANLGAEADLSVVYNISGSGGVRNGGTAEPREPATSSSIIEHGIIGTRRDALKKIQLLKDEKYQFGVEIDSLNKIKLFE